MAHKFGDIEQRGIRSIVETSAVWAISRPFSPSISEINVTSGEPRGGGNGGFFVIFGQTVQMGTTTENQKSRNGNRRTRTIQNGEWVALLHWRLERRIRKQEPGFLISSPMTTQYLDTVWYRIYSSHLFTVMWELRSQFYPWLPHPASGLEVRSFGTVIIQ
jgi:hypothetical protein